MYRDVGAGLGVGKSMMVVAHIVTTVGGNGGKLMIRELGQKTLRGAAGTVKLVVRIIHLVAAEDGFQAGFIKTLVVGDQRQPFDERFYLCPHVGKDRGIVGVSMT